ncbi:MAG: nucleotidyltransferase family protein [Thermoleophilia bacterium]|nr:nucleotidyltransferase family protein [Thermoleophilia bacterium]
MDIAEDIRKKWTAILEIAARHHATDVRLFGSVARGEAGPDSDVDLVVRFLPAATFLDYAVMVHKLEGLLGREVDVVCEAALYESTRERLASEEARPVLPTGPQSST